MLLYTCIVWYCYCIMLCVYSTEIKKHNGVIQSVEKHYGANYTFDNMNKVKIKTGSKF